MDGSTSPNDTVIQGSELGVVYLYHPSLHPRVKMASLGPCNGYRVTTEQVPGEVGPGATPAIRLWLYHAQWCL